MNAVVFVHNTNTPHPMIRKIACVASLFGLCLSSAAQLPQGINYQAIVRDNGGAVISEQAVTYQFSVLQGSASGTAVYTEAHAATTDVNGLVNLVIGAGNGTDDFSSIDWSAGPYFLEVAVDETGGNSPVALGASQLLSVPYALHAGTAEDVDDADADPSNELQSLSITGSTLSISDGNAVELPGGGAPDEAIAKAWVHFPASGTPNLAFDAYNVQSTSVTATGVRSITLPPGLFSPATMPAMVCQLRNDLAPGFCTVTSSASPSQVTVRTYSSNGTPADKEFSLLIFGR